MFVEVKARERARRCGLVGHRTAARAHRRRRRGVACRACRRPRSATSASMPCWWRRAASRVTSRRRSTPACYNRAHPSEPKGGREAHAQAYPGADRDRRVCDGCSAVEPQCRRQSLRRRRCRTCALQSADGRAHGNADPAAPAKVGLAGQQENWPLAAYAFKELRQGLLIVAKAVPRWKGLPVPDLLDAAMTQPLTVLDFAIKAGEPRHFADAYAKLTAGCNACHATTDHPFIVIKSAARRLDVPEPGILDQEIAGPLPQRARAFAAVARQSDNQSRTRSVCRFRGHRRIMAATGQKTGALSIEAAARLEERSMSEKIYDVPAEWKRRAFIDDAKYQEMYARSIKDPDGFWAEQAKRIDWIKPFTKVKNTSLHPATSRSSWFEDGTLNVSANCIDRHLAKRADQTAIIWEGDDPKESQAHHLPRAARRGLPARQRAEAQRGVKKGDRVTIYMPMIPEAAYAMLACARIGAVHSVVFGGFSPDSLAGRIEDCDSNVVITADEGLRGGRKVPLKANADEALARTARRRERARRAAHRRRRSTWTTGRDLWYHEAPATVSADCPPRGDERRGPAVHPLHLGLDRQAEGRAAHHRRLSRLHVDDAPVRLRLSRRRHLLVHRRCRLGHRPQLHRLRPARQRRDHADVRGRAELSRRRPLLAGGRQAQGQHLLHRADRDPRADARGRGAGEEDQRASRCACSARSASRSTRRPGCGTTAWSATAAARSSTPGGRPRPAAS